MPVTLSKEAISQALHAYFGSIEVFKILEYKPLDANELHFKIESISNSSAKVDIYLNTNGSIDYVDAKGSMPLESITPARSMFTSEELQLLKSILRQSME